MQTQTVFDATDSTKRRFSKRLARTRRRAVGCESWESRESRESRESGESRKSRVEATKTRTKSKEQDAISKPVT
jgi:hypothetical protein